MGSVAGPATGRPGCEALPPTSLTVDRNAILAYAAVTDDYNPLHVDEAFAAQTPFGQPIAHGMLSVNLIWQSLRKAVAKVLPMELDIRFVRPVLQGMRVTAGGAARAGDGVYDVWVRDDEGRDLILGTATVGRPR